MTGMLVAGRDTEGHLWAVETVELDMVPERGGRLTVGSVPDGDGAWLLVWRHGVVQWRRTVAELTDLGIDLAIGHVMQRWA